MAPETERADRDEHRARVHFGLKWTALSLALLRFGRLGTTIVLARLLAQEVFGVVAMAMAVLFAFQALRDMGFGHALVQRADEGPAAERRAASTTFWIVLAVNATMFAAGWLTAPAIGAAFPKLEGLVPVLRGMLFLLLVEAWSSTPTALLQRRLEFGKVASAEMVGVVLHAGLSIALALGGLEEWSLVYGTLGARFAQSALVARLARWRPTLELDAGVARDLFGFGKFLWGCSLLMAASKVVDKLVLGRLLGSAPLGVYSNSYNLCTTASKPLFSIVLRVAFPAMSRVRDDPAALRAGFLRAIGGVALLAVPFSVGLSVVAPEFVATVYGPRWAEMAPFVRVLAFYGLAMSVAAVSGPVLMATGRPRTLFAYALLAQVLQVVGFVALAGYGGVGIAWAVLVAALAAEGGAYVRAARAAGVGVAEATAPLARAAAASLVMLLALLAVRGPLAGELPRWALLAVEVPLAVLVYFVASRALNRDELAGAWTGLRDVAVSRSRA